MNRFIFTLALSVAAAAPAMAASGGIPITAAQVANAITASGMRVAPQQVALPSDVVATTSNPTLLVESVQPSGDRLLRVRLSCASADQCLPFLVAVHSDDSPSVQAVAWTPNVRPDPTAPSRANQFVVHAGSPAVLVLDSDHVHIRLAVVCLQNGAPGQTIRVETRDHSQTFEAQVQDAEY